MQDDVAVNQFLAIHEPWHHHAYYLLELTDKEWAEATWLQDPEEVNKLEQCGAKAEAKALAYVQKVRGITKTAGKTAAFRSIWYHGSPYKNLRSILSQGLIPNIKNREWHNDDQV